MIYFPSKVSCPNREKLATMTAQQACAWAAKASTECMEVSRLAEIETWFGLGRDATNALHRAAIRIIDEVLNGETDMHRAAFANCKPGEGFDGPQGAN